MARDRNVSATELTEVGKRIAAGLDDMTTGRNSLSSHLRWELVQVMSRVRPEDLSAVEIAALLVILTPAASRVIGGPAGRPNVPILGVRRKYPASNLA
jgi:hypothetical protein